jgi:pimeloyl-ACP methyl ester carboxylesterase
MSTVTSKDGTTIAYDCQGSGPAVILVDGAMGYRAFGFSPELSKLLAPYFTVYAYDRRGRGDSSDTQPFSVEREVEDLEALIDAAGGQAFVYGISSGACLALEAAMKLGSKIQKLALYEPPYNSDPAARQPWQDYQQKLVQLLSEGRRGDAVALFMNFVGTPPEMIEGMRNSPMWATLEAVAPTLPYDAAAMGADRVVPTKRAAQVTADTLVMDGGESMKYIPFMHATALALAQAIPHARQRTLEGQAHDVKSEVLAPILVEFFNS